MVAALGVLDDIVEDGSTLTDSERCSLWSRLRWRAACSTRRLVRLMEVFHEQVTRHA